MRNSLFILFACRQACQVKPQSGGPAGRSSFQRCQPGNFPDIHKRYNPSRRELHYQLRSENGQDVQSGVLSIGGSGVYGIRLNGNVRPGIYLLTLGNAGFIKNEKLRIL